MDFLPFPEGDIKIMGNSKSTFTTIGRTHKEGHERHPEDFYATNPITGEQLIEIEELAPFVWECACGMGHLSKPMAKKHVVLSTDLVYRGFGKGGVDFLNIDIPFDGDIVTNPPYKHAQDFIDKALALVPTGRKVCMFLKLAFCESSSLQKTCP